MGIIEKYPGKSSMRNGHSFNIVLSCTSLLTCYLEQCVMSLMSFTIVMIKVSASVRKILSSGTTVQVIFNCTGNIPVYIYIFFEN